MPRLRVHSLTMSVDGYVAGPDQSVDNPLGVGGGRLHEWMFATRTARRAFGQDGGNKGLDSSRRATAGRLDWRHHRMIPADSHDVPSRCRARQKRISVPARGSRGVPVAHWSGECGDAAWALRLFKELLPDRERVRRAAHTIARPQTWARESGSELPILM